MIIPRNKLAKGNNTRAKVGEKKNIINNENAFHNLCDKHKIKEIEFRTCKLIDEYGKITFLEHKQIKANMKASIMIVKYESSDYYKDGLYDLFKLALDKKIKENKKKEDDMKSAIKNFELDKTSQSDTTPDKSNAHELLLTSIKDSADALGVEETLVDSIVDSLADSAEKIKIKSDNLTESTGESRESTGESIGESTGESIGESTGESTGESRESIGESTGESIEKPIIQTSSVTPTEPIPELISASVTEPILESIPKPIGDNIDLDKLPNAKMERKRKEIIKKRDKIIKNLRTEMERKVNAKQRNKYNRHFISDINDKFGNLLIELPNYKYIELRKNTTDMVIEHSEVYKINLGTKETYLLIIGDLNVKSEVARKIDPSFESDKIVDEYEDFIERIKAKEKTKISVHDENILEQEFDNLEDIEYLPNDDPDDNLE